MRVTEMETIELTYPHSYHSEQFQETIAAIGFFDGVHLGHEQVINKAVQIAKVENKKSAVISFHPHPKEVLQQTKQPINYLTLMDEKVARLETFGVDYFYIISFTQQLSLLAPAQFIEHFVHRLHITHVVAGFDFTFGHNGIGNIENVSDYTTIPITTTKINEVKQNNLAISSTKIRHLLSAGDVDKAADLLGRPYETKGIVIHGDKRGNQLGFPTANLSIADNKLLPKQGVYAVEVKYNDETYNGMANVGMKPTFVTENAALSVEVNIFDFNEEIYDETLILYWYKYIRNEQRFKGIEEITAQLQQDEKKVRAYFE